MRRGWSDPEAAATWTMGRESRFTIDLPAGLDAATLVLFATPFVYPDRAVARLEIIANGIALGNFKLSAPSEIYCHVPAAAIGSSPALELTFRHPDAAKPSLVGVSLDTRELAMCIARIELRHRPGTTAPPTMANIPDVAAILTQFESVGDICEFGFVQRRCRLEPLGLFRFARAALPTVVNALEDRLAGLDDPTAFTLEFDATEAEGHIYLLHHAQYRLAWHSSFHAPEKTMERVMDDEQRKLRFLKRSFLEDLEEAAKIYIVRRSMALARDEVLPLWRALRRYGPNSLLWLVPADDAIGRAPSSESTMGCCRVSSIIYRRPRISPTSRSAAGSMSAGAPCSSRMPGNRSAGG
ncbi:MAG: hypothetical protein WDO24_08965 [Pseudomonadota bacterium]